MKKLFVIVSCTLLLLGAAGCSDDPETIIGTKEQPSWNVPEDYDMTVSMTAIVNVNLSLTYPEQVAALPDSLRGIKQGDMLAAFAGNTCLGVAELVDNLFFLYITGPASETQEGIQLRYYSSALKNNFVSKELIFFSNDAQLGSISAPYSPQWLMEK